MSWSFKHKTVRGRSTSTESGACSPGNFFLKISLKWSKRESIEVTMTTTMMMMIIMNAFV